MQVDLNDYRDKVVLVTGGAGAIGSNLSRALAQLEAQVFILDDFSSAEQWNVPSLSGILIVNGSILDEVKLKRVFFERPQNGNEEIFFKAVCCIVFLKSLSLSLLQLYSIQNYM